MTDFGYILDQCKEQSKPCSDKMPMIDFNFTKVGTILQTVFIN